MKNPIELQKNKSHYRRQYLCEIVKCHFISAAVNANWQAPYLTQYIAAMF